MSGVKNVVRDVEEAQFVGGIRAIDRPPASSRGWPRRSPGHLAPLTGWLSAITRLRRHGGVQAGRIGAIILDEALEGLRNGEVDALYNNELELVKTVAQFPRGRAANST
ncbi:MAG: hypothetical protein HQ465_07855 [Rhodospirillales bacterium]|nr:hypothetical protein [Rhodospirillales bacterium]